MKYTIGIDTGGTFTDIVIFDDAGGIYFDKSPTTPKAFEQGVVGALENCVKLMGKDMKDVLENTESFSHGTTVATNALIQRRGAKVGLIVTKGFEDTTLLARGNVGRNLGIPRSQAMDYIHNERPQPLVPHSLICGVSERVVADGTAIVSLNEQEVTKSVEYLIEEGVNAIAVCLLWSFRNNSHEQRIKEIIQQMKCGIIVSCSSEISPMMGEFERAMTAIENAYVAPVIVKYINNLQTTLSAKGLRSPVQVMKCSGGVTLPARIEKEAVSVLGSGPSGGVVAARYLGEVFGYENVITTDMGGTTFDVGLIHRGEYEYEKLPFFAQGVPAQVLSVKVVSIGAGGGSIAWTDGRRLLVGPRSAGSDPGPACYDIGGTEPTVTDALVVLGILDPAYFFGGRILLNRAKAEEAILKKVARPLNMDTREAAAGIYEVVTAMMGDLVRKVTVENGYDPRNFVLFSYGGAGPAGAAQYGAALGVKEVVIPLACACFSAFGCAISDVMYSYVYSEPGLVESTVEFVKRFNRALSNLEKQALEEMQGSGFPAEEVLLSPKLDMRYVGQLNDISVPWGGGELTLQQVPEIRHAFEMTYESKFGRGTTRAESPLELTNFRLDAIKITSKPRMMAEKKLEYITPTKKASRRIYFRKAGLVEASVYNFDDMAPGNFVRGLCIIERRDTTILVPAGQEAHIDGFRNIRIQRGR